MRYALLCDDNFDYMDESARYAVGEFDDADAAIAAAKQIVDRDLAEGFEPGMSADALYLYYHSFGSDPFIRSDDPSCRFSAWDYAKARCVELCGAMKNP